MTNPANATDGRIAGEQTPLNYHTSQIADGTTTTTTTTATHAEFPILKIALPTEGRIRDE